MTSWIIFEDALIRKKLAESKAKVPATVESMIKSFKNFRELLTFIFNRDSPLVESMTAWLRWADTYDYKMRHWLETDPLLIAKIMFHIDQRFQEFFASCIDAKTSEDLKYNALDFAEIKHEMKTKVIAIHVPQIIQSLAKPVSTLPSNNNSEKKRASVSWEKQDYNDKQDSTYKKPKTVAKRATPVDNEAVDQELKAKVKNNYNLFRRKFAKIPKSGNSNICGHYHLMGKCTMGSDCQRKDTHKELPQESVAALKAWVDSIVDGTEDH